MPRKDDIQDSIYGGRRQRNGRERSMGRGKLLAGFQTFMSSQEYILLKI